MHPKKPSTAALPRLRPFAPMERVSPYRPMSPGHPGHRQWRPRPECIRGRAPPGGVATASSGIRSASSASGPNPAACATILPSWQSTGGKRHAIPVPGPDPGDVRQPLPVRLSGREAPVGQAAGCGSRLAPAGTVPAPFGRVRHEPAPGHDPADRLLRDASSGHGLDPAVPVPAPGSGERPGHPDTRPGVSVSPGPGVAAVGGRPARCRASMSSSRANTPAPTGRSTGPPVRQAPQAGARVLPCDLHHLPHHRVPPGSGPRPCGAAPPCRRCRPRHSGFAAARTRACRSARRPCSRPAARPCRPCGMPRPGCGRCRCPRRVPGRPASAACRPAPARLPLALVSRGGMMGLAIWPAYRGSSAGRRSKDRLVG